ncbi:MAG: murein biosynthesis integral membrane protein MurJ, partial [Gemmatimonadetes bacterium]|nr:murein biosynthesis integral membrane protein MurJ [Gemmatimonadota bacterium]
MASPAGSALAAQVAAGILLTRILGFVRERVFAHYFGNTPVADAFRAALKIPNVIRNLLGEGTLSASFIPVYAGMIERQDLDGARKLSGSIASVLLVLTAGAALAGVVLAPVITAFAAPGFSGATRDLTVRLVAIMFPMSGLTILSAWCLGVLNTHRRFFLSYAAPAVWNVAQIATLVALGAHLAGAGLGVALAWGALAGSALQLAVQLPATLKHVGRLHWSLSLDTPAARTVTRNWIPVVFGAGVAQISSIIDTQLGSLLGAGAVATLGYAQLVAVLPVSLFGVSIAAAALPELSRDVSADASAAIRQRLAEGTRRVVFFVLPSAFAFATLGKPIVGTLFQ